MCQIVIAINTKWSKYDHFFKMNKFMLWRKALCEIQLDYWHALFWMTLRSLKAFFLENIERSLYLLIKSLEICHMASLVEIVLNQSWWKNESLWVTYSWLVEGLSYRLDCNRKYTFTSYHPMIAEIIQNHIPSLH